MIDLPIDRAVFDALVEMTGGDFAFVDDLIDTYFDDAREQLAAMQAAVASPDVAALVRPAHSLKTNSFNVGAMALDGCARTSNNAPGPARSTTLPGGWPRSPRASVTFVMRWSRNERRARRAKRIPRLPGHPDLANPPRDVHVARRLSGRRRCIAGVGRGHRIRLRRQE